MAFVLVIVGLAFITQISTLTLTATDKQSVVNEAIDISVARITADGSVNTSYPFTVTYAPTDWKVSDCPVASVVYGNSSADYTVTTDYTITGSSGVLLLKNTSTVVFGSNSTVIDYTYCGDDYLNSDWGRTVLLLVGGFFALALLGVGIGLFYSVGKEAGVF